MGLQAEISRLGELQIKETKEKKEFEAVLHQNATLPLKINGDEKFEIFHRSREAYREEGSKVPRIDLKKFLKIEPTLPNTSKEVINSKRKEKVQKIATYHHLQKGYVKVWRPVIKVEKALTTDSAPTTDQDLNGFQRDPDESFPNVCSRQCHKILNGEEVTALSIADETELKIQLLRSLAHADICETGKALNQPCNTIYIILKSLEIKDHATLHCPPNPKKVRMSQTYNAYQKRDKLYEGLPELYQPCSHEGKCNENCPCYLGKNYCEIFCGCSNDCNNKFPGCSCTAKCDSKLCPCFASKRECQEGHCRCKADCKEGGNCSNMKIFQVEIKKLEIKQSTVAGFGAFALENIKKGEFVIEYTGELIDQDEVERRGVLYAKRKTSYIFNLSKDYAVDAFFIGNESRFINHSDQPNCIAVFNNVFGYRRIGLYASRNINKGDELFFDYHYSDLDKEIYFK